MSPFGVELLLANLDDVSTMWSGVFMPVSMIAVSVIAVSMVIGTYCPC